MTDAEIIKGLERCTTTRCKVCPLKGCYTCYEELSENALALIERLQERVAIRQEPCKYCNPEMPSRFQDNCVICFSDGIPCLTIDNSAECESGSTDIMINNCPMCGRNLKGVE